MTFRSKVFRILSLGLATVKRAQLVFAKSTEIDLLNNRAFNKLIIGRQNGLKVTDAGGTAVLDLQNGRINIPDSPFLKSVSRKQAKLTWNNEARKYEIEDVGSTYGTRVNKKKLRRGVVVILEDKNKVKLAEDGTNFQILYS